MAQKKTKNNNAAKTVSKSHTLLWGKKEHAL